MADKGEQGRGYHDIGGLDYGPIDPAVTDVKPWEKLSTAISNALGRGGQLLGRPVLVTGASGGVGLYGVQLAKLSGATVTALIRREAHRNLVREAGADNVIVGDRATGAATHGPYHCILDSVGGQVLTDCLHLVHKGGVLVNYGVSAGERATVDVGDFFRIGRTRYYGLYLFTEFGRRPAWDGLEVLAGLVADGKLDIHIDAEDEFAGLGRMAERLFNREITGKAVPHGAVLTVGQWGVHQGAKGVPI